METKILNLVPQLPSHWVISSYTGEHTGFMHTLPVPVFDQDNFDDYDFLKNIQDDDFENYQEIYLIPSGGCLIFIAFDNLYKNLDEQLTWSIENNHMGDDEFYDYFPDGITCLMQLHAAYLKELSHGLTGSFPKNIKEDTQYQINKLNKLFGRIREYNEELAQECCLDNLQETINNFYQLHGIK